MYEHIFLWAANLEIIANADSFMITSSTWPRFRIPDLQVLRAFENANRDIAIPGLSLHYAAESADWYPPP
jgi:hypothetical protein